MVSKKPLPSQFTAFQRLLPITIIFIVISSAIATQLAAYIHHYPTEFGSPLFYFGDIRLYQPMLFLIWALAYPGIKGVIYGWIGFCLSFGGLLSFTWFLWARMNTKARAGDMVYGSASWGDPSNPKYGLLQRSGLVLGKIFDKGKKGYYLIDNRDTHAIVAATTGSGKTAGPVVLTLLSYDGSMIVTDIKGELFKSTSGLRSKFSDVHNFNPLDENPTTKINPLLLVRPGLNAVADCITMATSLIPQPENQRTDEHWGAKSREWITSALLYILYCEERKNVHLGYLYEFVCGTEDFGQLMKRCKISEEHDPTGDIQKYIQTTAQGIVATPQKEAGSIKSTITRHIEVFRNPKAVNTIKESTLDLRDMLTADRPQTLYITVPPNEVNVVTPIIKIIFEMGCRILLEEEPRRIESKNEIKIASKFQTLKNGLANFLSPVKEDLLLFRLWPKLANRHNVMFLIDESPRYGKMETIEKAIGLLRSYGVRVVFITQSLATLQKIYGETSEIFHNTGVKLFLGTTDIAEAKAISDLVGTSTSGYLSQSVNRATTSFIAEGETKQSNRFGRPLINADEVTRLSEAEGVRTGILIIQGILPMKVRNAFYFEDSRIFSYTQIPAAEINPNKVIISYWHQVNPDNVETVGKGTEEEITTSNGHDFHGDFSDDEDIHSDSTTDLPPLTTEPYVATPTAVKTPTAEEVNKHNESMKAKGQKEIEARADNVFNRNKRPPLASASAPAPASASVPAPLNGKKHPINKNTSPSVPRKSNKVTPPNSPLPASTSVASASENIDNSLYPPTEEAGA